MINTGPSNDKIYQRCVALVGDQAIMKSWGRLLARRGRVRVPPAVARRLPRLRDASLARELGAAAPGRSALVSVPALVAGVAELCLLQAIYNSDTISEALCQVNVSDHIKQYLSQVDAPCSAAQGVENSSTASGVTAVLPVAFLLSVSAYEMFLAAGEEGGGEEGGRPAETEEVTTTGSSCLSSEEEEEEAFFETVVGQWNSSVKSKWTVQSAKNALREEPRLSQLLKNVLAP
jgi:hypothetical protein